MEAHIIEGGALDNRSGSVRCAGRHSGDGSSQEANREKSELHVDDKIGY